MHIFRWGPVDTATEGAECAFDVVIIWEDGKVTDQLGERAKTVSLSRRGCVGTLNPGASSSNVEICVLEQCARPSAIIMTATEKDTLMYWRWTE